MKKLTIISAGLGNIDYLTGEAINIISNHTNIYISEKRFSNLKQLNSRIKIVSYSKLEETISKATKDIAIIVSGDYGFYSIAKTLIRIFKDTKEIQLINGLNSMQYFASKLNLVYHDWAHLSIHGSNIHKLLSYVSYNEKTFIITGGKQKVENICERLLDAGFSNLNIFVGENLSYENERIIFGSLQEINQMTFGELTVMLIENPYFKDSNSNLKNEDFVFSKIPIKNEVLRATIVNKLDINHTDIIYHIGFGAGDASLDIAKKANSGLVYSFDYREIANQTLEKNKIQNGIFNIININASDPYFDESFFEEMEFLQPNKILISGDFYQIEDVFDWVLKLNPYCKIVLETSSLDKVYQASNCYEKFGIIPEIASINISNVKETEKGNLLFAENPIFIVSGEAQKE